MEISNECKPLPRSVASIDGLDVCDFDGEGYVRAVTFAHWRVAFLNHAERFAALTYIERHLQTDEVFVLLEGRARLVIGESLELIEMEPNRLYNVRKGIWHQIITMPGTHCLVIENSDTDHKNSERKDIK